MGVCKTRIHPCYTLIKFFIWIMVMWLMRGDGENGDEKARVMGKEPMRHSYRCDRVGTVVGDDEWVGLVVRAIWVAEGGGRTRYPYGVKSVKVRGVDEAREVCERTVRNNLRRWREGGSRGGALEYLGNVYCPEREDREGNRNWKRNVGKLIGGVRPRGGE